MPTMSQIQSPRDPEQVSWSFWIVPWYIGGVRSKLVLNHHSVLNSLQ